MFERFTEEASRALFFARLHTSVRLGATIDAGDLLQGVLVVGFPAVARFESEPGAVTALVTPEFRRRDDEDREAWARRILRQDLGGDTAREIPFAGEAKAVLETAMAEADALDHTAIRPEHLLLGILRQEGSSAWQALMDAGVTLRGVREALARGE